MCVTDRRILRLGILDAEHDRVSRTHVFGTLQGETAIVCIGESHDVLLVIRRITEVGIITYDPSFGRDDVEALSSNGCGVMTALPEDIQSTSRERALSNGLHQHLGAQIPSKSQLITRRLTRACPRHSQSRSAQNVPSTSDPGRKEGVSNSQVKMDLYTLYSISISIYPSP